MDNLSVYVSVMYFCFFFLRKNGVSIFVLMLPMLPYYLCLLLIII